MKVRQTTHIVLNLVAGFFPEPVGGYEGLLGDTNKLASFYNFCGCCDI